MNPLTGLTNQDALARYASMFNQPEAGAAGKYGETLSLQYMRLQSDRVELSADGKQMYAVSKSLEVLYASTTTAVAEAADPAAEAEAAAALEGFYSPENTAQRIMDFAVSFFPAFSANHAGSEADTVQDEFRTLMRNAIEEGFAQARGLLDEFFSKETPDFVSSTIGQTYELLQQKLDAFTGSIA